MEQLQFPELQPIDIIRIEGEQDTPDETWVRMIMRGLKLIRGDE